MTSSPQTLIERRHDQMFPTLDPIEIERVRHLGETQTFAAGETLLAAGQVGPGLMILFSGRVDVTHREASGSVQTIVSHGPGEFIGELAQMAGRPALVDATAIEPVQALVMQPNRLRSLFVAEADLGERIMRALILRRVGLLETAGGPIIVGRADNGDVLRLQVFLRRNGHPQRLLDPTTDPEAKALIERFHVDPGQLPIVLCPSGTVAAQSERETSSRAASALVGPIDPRRSSTWPSSAPDRPGLRPRSMRPPKGLSVLVLDCRAFGGQAGASARIENYLGFPTGITGMALMARAYNQAQKFGAEMAIPDEAQRISSEDGNRFVLRLANGEHVTRARCHHRQRRALSQRLALRNLDAFEGSSVHYWASPLEAQALHGPGSRAGRRRQLGRSGGGLSRRARSRR